MKPGRVILVATRHERYARGGYFREGDIVIDPFGYIPDQDGVLVIRVGRR